MVRIVIAATALAMLALQAKAIPATLVVGPGEKYTTPTAAARAARDGDTVRILPGTYRDACVWRANRLNIVGPASSGEVKVLPPEGGRLAERKGLCVLYGSDIRISGISFEGARCPDKNGAGLWIGANSGTTRVDRCSFTHNENGILTTAAPSATISIKNSTFRNCGHGDGYSHNIYVGKVGRLVCEGIVSDHCNQGHCLKSRALATEIVNCRFDDGNDGLSSYLVNCPNGGKVRLERSTLVQSPVAPNGIMVSIGEEGPYPNSSFKNENNRFDNRRANGRTLRVRDS